MNKAYLVCVHDNSKKFYVIEMLRKGGRLLVRGTWGRIGAEPRTQIKYEGQNEFEAKREFQKVLSTRYEHGYDLISSS